MAKKKENFKDMAEGELTKELASLQEKLRVSRFKREGSKSKNVKEEASLRKDIARVLTIINNK